MCFPEEIDGPYDVTIFSKYIIVMKTWRVRPLTLGSGDRSFLSHYAIVFCDLQQLLHFYKYFILVKRKMFPSSVILRNMFIAMNIVFGSVSARRKIGGSTK